MTVQQILSTPGFNDETDAWAEFDRRADKSGCFRIYREVCGELIQPRVGAEQKGVRIDRILVPTIKLLEAGWIHGPVGVEGKRSEHKIGKAISQAMDYSRSVFDLGQCSGTARMPGFLIMLQWVFLWPFSPDPGDIVSVMMQNRIGCVTFRTSAPDSLLFKADAIHAIDIFGDGRVVAKQLPMGRKAGNRG